MILGRVDGTVVATRKADRLEGLKLLLVRVVDPEQKASGATIVIIYTAEVTGGELEASDDADAAEFFALTDLPPLAFEATRVAIEAWRRRA